MSHSRNNHFHCVIALSLSLILAGCATITAADQHVVSPSELQKTIVEAAQSRQADLAKLQRMLSAEPAAKVLRAAGIDYERVKTAVSGLDDQELAQLAARADKVQNDFAAGALTREQLTYVVIALATAVVILIIIEAR